VAELAARFGDRHRDRPVTESVDGPTSQRVAQATARVEIHRERDRALGAVGVLTTRSPAGGESLHQIVGGYHDPLGNHQIVHAQRVGGHEQPTVPGSTARAESSQFACKLPAWCTWARSIFEMFPM